MLIREMTDGRFVGITAMEITAFPSLSSFAEPSDVVLMQNREAFLQMIQEFHRIAIQKNACLEMLWITESVRDQVVQSRIRLFITVRCIAASEATVRNDLQFFSNSITPILSTRNYSYEADQIAEMSALLKKVNTESAISVVKAEQITGNLYSPYPYYCTAVLPDKNINNYDLFISTLGQTPNCCVAFQLLPTCFRNEEYSFLNEQNALLDRLARGFFSGKEFVQDTAAAQPQRVLSYYLSKARSPLFQYNILCFGSRTDCAKITSRIVGVLQAGREAIGQPNCICLDLSRESISLIKQLLYYPWNINNLQIYTYRNKKTIQTFLNIAALKRLPYILTAEEAASFFRLPIHDKKMPALRE